MGIPFDESISLGAIALRNSEMAIWMQAKQLADEIPRVTNEHGTRHLNIIAHSKGGLDCRQWLVLDKPTRDAARQPKDRLVLGQFVTLNTPHTGSILADYGIALTMSNLSREEKQMGVEVANRINPAIGELVWGAYESGKWLFLDDQATDAAFDLQTIVLTEFNRYNMKALATTCVNPDGTRPEFLATQSDPSLNDDKKVTNSSPDELKYARAWCGWFVGSRANYAYQALGRVVRVFFDRRNPPRLLRQEAWFSHFEGNDLLVTLSSAAAVGVPQNVFRLIDSYTLGGNRAAKSHAEMADDDTARRLVSSQRLRPLR
jgi:hypothetical protein